MHSKMEGPSMPVLKKKAPLGAGLRLLTNPTDFGGVRCFAAGVLFQGLGVLVSAIAICIRRR